MGRSKAKKFQPNLSSIPEESSTGEVNESKGESVISKENKCNDVSIVGFIKKINCDSEKVDLWRDKHVFKLVLKTLNPNDTFNQNNPLLDNVNNHRKEYITNLIKTKYREIIQDLADKKTDDKPRDVVIAINKAWTKQFIESLDTLIISDRIELTNARVYKFYNYKIVIKDEEGEKEQAVIDFIGLCWLFYAEKFIAPGLKMDVVVSLRGFRMFFCIIVAIEFFNEMLKYTLLYAYYSKKKMLKLEDIKILSDEFGVIFYPSEKAITIFSKKYIEYYPNWKRIPYITSF
jgi:hypothetical protein